MSSRWSNRELAQMVRCGETDEERTRAFELLADRIGESDAMEMVQFGEVLN